MAKMFYGASPNIFEKAKVLRDDMTEAEKLLWNRLSNKQLGYRFRRQHPIGSFIADFYCHKAKLVVEVDGSVHQEPEQADYDIGRTYEIEALEIKVIRFTNAQIEGQMTEVLERIKSCLKP